MTGGPKVRTKDGGCIKFTAGIELLSHRRYEFWDIVPWSCPCIEAGLNVKGRIWGSMRKYQIIFHLILLRLLTHHPPKMNLRKLVVPSTTPPQALHTSPLYYSYKTPKPPLLWIPENSILSEQMDPKSKGQKDQKAIDWREWEKVAQIKYWDNNNNKECQEKETTYLRSG